MEGQIFAEFEEKIKDKILAEFWYKQGQISMKFWC